MRIQLSAIMAWGCVAAACALPRAAAQDFAPTGPYEAVGGIQQAGGLWAQPRSSAPAIQQIAGSREAAWDPQFVPAGGMADAAPEYPPGDPGYPAPPGFAGWPTTSPYDHVWDQTAIEDGLWYRESLNPRREYSFGLEYIRSFSRRPGSDIIGDSNAPFFQPSPITPVALLRRGFATQQQGGQQGQQQQQFLGSGPLQFFTPQNMSVFDDEIEGNGIRASFMMKNADDTRLLADVFFIGEATDEFSPAVAPRLPQDIRGQPLRRLRGGLPLPDATGGFTLPFDTAYNLTYMEQSMGANIDWMSMPIWGGDRLNARLVWGAKYLKIRERFTFFGRDSGLRYTVDRFGIPVTGSIVVDPLVPEYSAALDSATRSQLAGPEIGIAYQLGGENLKFFGHTKVAVAANNERAVLNGRGFENAFEFGATQPTALDPNPTGFFSQRSTTHVSPILDTAISAQAPIFRHIPVVNDIYLFREAYLKVGYNFILAGEVIRPTQIVQWRAPAAHLDFARTRWSVQMLTIGLDWRF